MATKSASLTTPLVDQRPRERTIEEKQRLWGWLFMSPWLVGFAIFTAFPMVASLYFSFTDFKIGQDINWVGLKNWQQLFTDPITLGSLGVTLRFGIYVLPVAILVPLALATLLTSKALVGKPFFRLFFYMPFIVPAISGIFVWQAFLNGNTGWLNRILRLFGMENPPAWTTDSHYLNTALVLIGLWGIGNALLTMMAAMTSLPTELYEAARVDGAGPVRTWRSITLPLITPVIFYNLVLACIGLMQYFVVPYVLSNNARSDPNLNFINLHLYRTAFQYSDMGYASVLAWFMFLVGLAITLGLFASARRWVYYASGDN